MGRKTLKQGKNPESGSTGEYTNNLIAEKGLEYVAR